MREKATYKIGIILLVGILLMGGLSTKPAVNSQVINFSVGTITINYPFIINSSTVDPLTGAKGSYSFDANVNVVSGGALIVENATLQFIQDAINPVTLTIESGGSFVLVNSTFTVSPSRYYPSINFTITSIGGSIGFYNSILKYPGWFNVSNSKGIKIINTIFTSENSSQLSQLLKYGYPSSAIPYVAYGPTPVFTNVTLILENTKFPSLFQAQKSVNTYSGTFPSTGTFPKTISSTSPGITTVSSSFSVTGFQPYTTFYNATVVVNITANAGYSGDSYIYVNFNNLNYVTPVQFTQNPQNFTTGVNFYSTYFIANQTALSKANGFFVNITKPSAGSITVNWVRIILYTYNFNFIKQNFNVFSSTVYGSDVYISANSNNSNGNPFKNYIYATGSNIYLLNWTIFDYASYSAPPDPPYFIDQYTNIYLYRHLYVHVINYNGAPLQGLSVNVNPNVLPVVLNGITILNNTIVNNLNSILWNNLGINIVGTTDSKGGVNYALFSDWINYRFWPNALFGGDYNLTVSVNGNLLKMMSLALPIFPHLNSTGVMSISISVIVPDIVAISLQASPIMVHYKSYQITLKSTVFGESVANIPVAIYLGNSNIINTLTNIQVNKTNYLNLTFTVPGTFVPGNYTLKAIFNPFHTVYESNYSNNAVSQRVEIYPSIDLAVINPSFSSPVLYENNYLNFTVINYGLDNAFNVTVNVAITGPNGFSYFKSLKMNLNASQSIAESVTYFPQFTGAYTFNIYIPYYWDFNQSNNMVFLSESYGIDYYFIDAGYVLTANITPNTPMNVLLFSKIYVNGIVPAYAPQVMVSFMDLTNNINIGNAEGVYSNGYIYANLSTNYFIYGYPYRVSAVLNPYRSVQETNYSNNYYNFTLYIPAVYGSGTGNLGPYMNGSLVPIYANITSGSSGINNVSIIFYFPTLGIEKIYEKSISPNSKISIVYYMDTSKINMMGKNSITVPYEILITYSQISPYYLIFSSGFISILERPNLYLKAFLVPNTYVKDFTKVPMGDNFQVNMTVENNGGWTAFGNSTITVIDNGVQVFSKNLSNIPPGGIFYIKFNITAESTGMHDLIIFLNYTNITQKIPGTREFILNYTVITPSISVVMIVPSQPPVAGETFTLIFYALNNNATVQQGRNVYMNNMDINVYIGGKIYPVHIGSNGVGVLTLNIQNSGDYTVIVSYTMAGSSFQQTLPVKVHVASAPFTLPFWLIVAVVLIAVVGGIFGYAFLKYRKVEKNLMVCGNCGSLIPADSEKCPVCGVVFEKENVKCGNCGSWIKKDAKYCPVCGAIYMDKDDPEYMHIESMRKEYLDEIQKYKEEAKRDLGENFTDEEFYKWWNTKPEFITFQNWMERKEEEKRPSVVCPVCGTLNPKGTKFCRVCGSPLPEEEKK